MNRWLVVLAGFAAALVATLAVSSLAGAREEALRRRLGVYLGGGRREVPAAPARRGGRQRRGRGSPGRQRAGLERLDRFLAEADWPLRAREFLLLQAAGGVVLGAFLGIFRPWLALPGLLAGASLGWWWLARARARRLTTFNEQLVEALEVMANSLRSGFSFFQSMEMVAEETPPPLGREFARTLQELALGTPTEEGLLRLSERVRSADLGLVVTAVLIQRQVGGNLAEVLERIAHTIRERVRVRGEVKTLTAQGRLSGLVVGALPFVLAGVLALLNPEYIGLLVEEPLGRLLAAAGLAAELVGAMVIRRMVRVDY